jgi:transcriptional regulator with XRE-family HTH domain
MPESRRGKRGLWHKVEAVQVDQGWDDDDLAELLGCSRAAISKWRHGIHVPGRRKVLENMVALVDSAPRPEPDSDAPSKSQQRRLDNGLVQLNVPVTRDTRAKLRLISAMQSASYADILTAHIDDLYKATNVDEVVKLAREIR